MRSKWHSQKSRNKFIRFIRVPLKALRKARDFYVRSLENCSSRINCGECTDPFSCQYYELPTRFSESSSATYNVEEEDHLTKLIEPTSVRSSDHENEIDKFSPKRLRLKMRSKGLPKNMGRIDEDRPCEFEENDVDLDFVLVGKKSKFGIKSQHQQPIYI